MLKSVSSIMFGAYDWKMSKMIIQFIRVVDSVHFNEMIDESIILLKFVILEIQHSVHIINFCSQNISFPKLFFLTVFKIIYSWFCTILPQILRSKTFTITTEVRVCFFCRLTLRLISCTSHTPLSSSSCHVAVKRRNV